MSFSVATLQRLSAAALSEIILADQGDAPSWAVVDVRDDDHIGGHIRGSRHVPSHTLDDARMPSLVRQLRDKATVVFHCALSQQRGPGAALRYLRERERMVGGEAQTVYVLDRGFVGWQEAYGEDERLTENYRKELWED